MTINLKTTLLFSFSAAAALNIGQFLASYHQHELAFVPTWAQADTTSAAAPTAASASAAPAVKLTAAHDGTDTLAPISGTHSSSTPTAPTTDAIAAALSHAGLKPDYAALYLKAQQQTDTPWQLVAAVHEVETGQSGSTSRTSSAGAVGPMQFLPATFAHYGTDGDGDGRADITNVSDAVLSAARYLAASGAARGYWSSALYNYNHSSSYVSRVLTIAYRLGL